MSKLGLRILVFVSISILMAAPAMGQESGVGPGVRSPSSWERFTVKGDDFSVSLPTRPSMASDKVFQIRLQNRRLERRLEVDAQGVFFSIDVFENAKPRQSLEEFVAEQIATSAYEPTAGGDLNVNGIAGKEYVAVNKPSPTTVQFFVTERRLYRFSASGRPASDPNVKYFFASILLGKKTGGTEVSDGPGLQVALDDGERIYSGKLVDVKARLLSKPEPRYPESARKAGTTGVVILKTVFASTGKVVNIKVIVGLPNGLTEAAIEAAKKIRFTPAMKEGKPVSMWMQLEYNFNL